MDTKYTKGPWRMSERENPTNSPIPFAIEKVVGSAVMPIADICNFPPATSSQTEYQRANGKLIAAAPEMYEALMAFICAFNSVGKERASRLLSAVIQAEAITQKATCLDKLIID